MWLNLSAAQGNPKAAEAREFLALQMTPAQIVAAQRLAAEWKPEEHVNTAPTGLMTEPQASPRLGKDCSGIPKEKRTLDCALPSR